MVQKDWDANEHECYDRLPKIKTDPNAERR